MQLSGEQDDEDYGSELKDKLSELAEVDVEISPRFRNSFSPPGIIRSSGKNKITLNQHGKIVMQNAIPVNPILSMALRQSNINRYNSGAINQLVLDQGSSHKTSHASILLQGTNMSKGSEMSSIRDDLT